MRSVLDDRRSLLVINGIELEQRRVLGGAPQGSPLLPILFLFYNVELVEMCSQGNTSAVGFIDNINILAYSRSTEQNYNVLEAVHD